MTDWNTKIGDYKVCTRAIAGRLLRVIHHVVAPDQTCGVPSRFIGENVALLRDVAQFANELNIPVAILSLDQEKAFDRVDGLFFSRPCLAWVLAPPSSVGSSFFIPTFVAPFLLMGIPHVLLSPLVVCGRDALSPPSCTY